MRTPARGRWPAGLVGMIALVACAERYVARHDPMFTTIGVSSWRRSGAEVPEASRAAVVAFGDSLVEHGLVPSALAARLGRPAHNLAMPKGTAPAHFFLLRRLLRAGGRPSAVLVDGEMLAEDPLDNPRVWPELARPAELAELARSGRDPSFLARTALAEVLPTYRARGEVRLRLTAALAGTVPPETMALGTVWRNWNANGGAYVLPDRNDPPGADPRPAELARVDYRPPPWSCHPVNAEFIDRFLALASEHGVPVFWLLPPFHPGVQERRERFGWNGTYDGFVRRLQARHPHLTVIDGRRAGYPPEALSDLTHLSRTGAVAFSDAVGGVLRDRLATGRDRPGPAPRWLEIPRYDPDAARALAAASPAEDLNQSGQSLRRLAVEGRRKRHDRRVARGGRPDDRRRR